MPKSVKKYVEETLPDVERINVIESYSWVHDGQRMLLRSHVCPTQIDYWACALCDVKSNLRECTLKNLCVVEGQRLYFKIIKEPATELLNSIKDQ